MMAANGQQKSKLIWYGLGILLLGLLIAGIGFLVNRKKQSDPPLTDPEPDTTTKKNIDPKKFFKSIVNACKDKGFGEQASIAIAGVAAHESAQFTSRLVNENNNMFGMGDPGSSRPSTAIGIKNGFAEYEDLGNSLEDYFLLLEAKNYPKSEDLTVDQHVQWMKTKKYFTDVYSVYLAGVQRNINALNQ